MTFQKPLSTYGKYILGISCEKFKDKYYFSSGIRFDINLWMCYLSYMKI